MRNKERESTTQTDQWQMALYTIFRYIFISDFIHLYPHDLHTLPGTVCPQNKRTIIIIVNLNLLYIVFKWN